MTWKEIGICSILGFLLACLLVFMGTYSHFYHNDPRVNSDITNVTFDYAYPSPYEHFDGVYKTYKEENKKVCYLVCPCNNALCDIYIDHCVNQYGYTNIQYDIESSNTILFGAYTTDNEYWIEIELDKKKNMMTILCERGGGVEMKKAATLYALGRKWGIKKHVGWIDINEPYGAWRTSIRFVSSEKKIFICSAHPGVVYGGHVWFPGEEDRTLDAYDLFIQLKKDQIQEINKRIEQIKKEIERLNLLKKGL